MEPVAKPDQTPSVVKQPEPVIANSKPTTAEKPVEKTKPELPVDSPAVTKSATKEMYFIQIAALARHSSLEPYAQLKAYGDLVLYDDGKYAKVRVGTFETESEARLVLSRIRSEANYQDAFVVKQTVSDKSRHVQVPVTSGEYKVRLGTYSKVGNFNPDLVSHLGAVESYRKDDLTIMLLAGFADLAAAKKALDAAVAKGFTDAYIVMDRGGILEKVHQ
jgi:hypothetical protein